MNQFEKDISNIIFTNTLYSWMFINISEHKLYVMMNIN